MPTALIVDDYEANLYLLRAVLEGHGFTVIEAHDGQQALGLALDSPPDIVISDILMPVMDGFTLCRLWRENTQLKPIPFVFYTATYTDPRDEQLALDLGADLFLVKPIEPTPFMESIAGVLRRYEQGRLQPPAEAALDEVGFLQEHNRALIRKLEGKVADLAKAHCALLIKEFAIESATSAVVLADLDGRVTYANTATAQLRDGTTQELIGRPLDGLFDQAEAVSDLVASLAAGRGWSGELSLTREDGSKLALDARAHTVRGPQGDPVCRMLLIDDVTERRRMAEDVQRTHRLASLSLFAAGLAHDFNNLLTGLFGHIELAKATLPPSDPAAEHLAAADLAFRRAQGLTSRLLSFARAMPVERRECSPVELLEQCAMLTLVGSTIRHSIDARRCARAVVGNANELSQVFTNVFANARQAMPNGGVIRVVVEDLDLHTGEVADLSAGPHVCVSVVDQGVGIAPADLARIFDPFFTTKADGSGLGLTVCHTIVANHGGHIAITSEPGLGTTVRIWLPACSQAAAVREAPPAPADGAGSRAHVLVMDDEPLIRDMLVGMLKAGGCVVDAVADGATAIERCRDAEAKGTPYDVAILDLTVPGAMGGLGALQPLQERHPRLAVVLSSGYGQEVELPETTRPVGWLPKPYRMHELLACVRAAAGR